MNKGSDKEFRIRKTLRVFEPRLMCENLHCPELALVLELNLGAVLGFNQTLNRSV